MFLNDTACNLASLNLMKFVDADGEFDPEAYRYAAKVTLTAQEILVDNASATRRRRSRRTATSSGRSASATPTSARC